MLLCSHDLNCRYFCTHARAKGASMQVSIPTGAGSSLVPPPSPSSTYLTGATIHVGRFSSVPRSSARPGPVRLLLSTGAGSSVPRSCAPPGSGNNVGGRGRRKVPGRHRCLRECSCVRTISTAGTFARTQGRRVHRYISSYLHVYI